MDEAVFLGDQVTLLATVSVTDVADANLTIRLRDHSSGEVLDQKPVKLTKQISQQQLSLAFIPKKAGEMVLQLDVSEVRVKPISRTMSFSAVFRFKIKRCECCWFKNNRVLSFDF